MILITELIIILSSGILLWHAGKEDSFEFTVLFWIGGGVMGFTREWVMTQYTQLYSYGDFTLSLNGVPVIFLLFWTNLAYVALRWSENIFHGKRYLDVNPPHYFYPIVFLISCALAIMISAFGSQYDLIHWNIQSKLMLWGRTPLIVPFEYGVMAVVYLSVFREIWRRHTDFMHRLWRLLGWIPVIVLVQIGAIFIIKLGIDIFTGVMELH